MNDRVGIPVLALLGLSFTSCVDRSKDDAGDEDAEPMLDPIVGEWLLSQLDAEPFPMTYGGMGYSARQGLELTVDEDLAGDFTFYFIYDYQGVESGMFFRSAATIDASKAPEYRLEAPSGLFPLLRPDYPEPIDPTGYSSITITGYDTYGSTYESDSFGSTYGDTEGDTFSTSGDTDSDTSGGTDSTTGGVRNGGLGAPIFAPRGPDDHEGPDGPDGPLPLLLNCTLVQDDALECQRERVTGDTEDMIKWRFKRANPDKPSGV